ncbi:MAG TPA: cytochrome c oxidase subunit II [Ktedonobacteraceae bacterium]|nr:cytochrome c oxidase subunit II [Ktedonobacteraceae bacterium]
MSEPNIEGSPAGASPPRGEPNHLRRALIIWGILSVIGIALVILLVPLILPASASNNTSTDDFTIVVLTVLAVPVSFFVFVFLGYSMFAFKVKDRPTEAAVPLQPRPGLQIGWLGITSVLCLFLLIWGMFAFYQETSASSNNTLVVQVTAQQWLWTFYLPQYGVSNNAQQLELPVGRPVQFTVTSEDVLHGFSIDALGVRVDANPGEMTTTPVVTPTQIGQYRVACVELCGLYHSYMWSAVSVVSNSTFNSWITSLGGNP